MIKPIPKPEPEPETKLEPTAGPVPRLSLTQAAKRSTLRLDLIIAPMPKQHRRHVFARFLNTYRRQEASLRLHSADASDDTRQNREGSRRQAGVGGEPQQRVVFREVDDVEDVRPRRVEQHPQAVGDQDEAVDLKAGKVYKSFPVSASGIASCSTTVQECSCSFWPWTGNILREGRRKRIRLLQCAIAVGIEVRS